MASFHGLEGGYALGRIARGQKCTVIGCSAPAARSLPIEKVARAGLKLEGGRRAYLCEAHHKEYKRRTREERRLEKWRFMGRAA